MAAGQQAIPEIDFVLIWVDGSDPEWRKERAKYEDKPSDSDESRYRDWGILPCWFRAVELYAPWVRTIHFVTCGQQPAWLNIHHPKLHFVKHSDFIPPEYLPTFSSHTIELNLHRIPGLAEHFVYFNDDMFLNGPVAPEDFFRDGKPCDSAVLSTIKIERYGISSIVLNNLKIINDRFSFRESFGRNRRKWITLKYGKHLLRTFLLLPWHYFTGFYEMHIPYAYTKTLFAKVWQEEPEVLRKTCEHKFRDDSDVNQWLFRYWILAEGSFEPRSVQFGKLYFADQETEGICREIQSPKHRMFCISDTEDMKDFDQCRGQIRAAFEHRYPEKSSYERQEGRDPGE